MNKTKRALISMLVISTVFCLTIIFNIQLPLLTADRSSAVDDTVPAESDAITEGTQEDTIHSFNIDEAEIFNADQYSASSETHNDTAAATPTVPAEANANETAEQTANTEATKEATTDQTTPEDNSKSVAEAEKAVEEEQPEAQYANIGISVAKDYVNIRKDPSTDSEILGKLYRDSACTILKSEDGWYYVESGSVTGYINSDFIKTGIPDDELIEKYGSLKMVVTVDGLNVREDPSTESKKLTVVYEGEKYPVKEIKDNWLYINIDDENLKGYVKEEFAELDVEFAEAVSKEEEQKILQLQAEERAKKETEVVFNNGVSYSEADLKLLACLVHAEAGSQSYECKLAVANIVLNRVKSSKYPDSIKSVIYQSGQFSVARSGSLDKQLDSYEHYDSNAEELSIKAAKDALEGANNIGDRLYFHTYKVAAKKGYTSYSKSVKMDGLLFW